MDYLLPIQELTEDKRALAEDAVRDLLSADTVLPEQFWALREASNSNMSGERALMWAVLTDGIDCYRRNAQGNTVQRRAEFQEAECWIFTTDWSWPFSFVNLCETFGLNPAGVRWALLKWRRQQKTVSPRRRRFRPVTRRAA